MDSSPLKQKCSLADILRRPELTIDHLTRLDLDEDLCQALTELAASPVRDGVQLQIKFQCYLQRQDEQVARFRKMEHTTLHEDLDYSSLSGLSAEVVEKMSCVRPRSLGQASRISGITPAAISILQVHLRKRKGA